MSAFGRGFGFLAAWCRGGALTMTFKASSNCSEFSSHPNSRDFDEALGLLVVGWGFRLLPHG
jgi:hypothetical protein